MLKKRLTTVLAVALLALGLGSGLPSAARADDNGGGGANTAVAINTKDGGRLFKLAFAIRRAAGDVVDQQNAAVAYSSCTSCQTIAIAIEIVLVEGSPSVVTPENVALSVNYECTLCTSYAAAYQFVIGGNGPIEFTAQGKQELEQIRRELQRLGKEFKKGDISLEEVKAQVELLIQRLKHVLETELVPAHTEKGVGNEPPPLPPPPPPQPPAETTSTQETTTTPTGTETTTTPTETTTTTTGATTTTTP